jgi:uncharacterized membrane protein
VEKQRIVFRQPFWLLGFGLFLVGNVSDFIGLSFASQTIVAPLGSVALLTNSIYAPCFLKERFHVRDLIATFTIITGTVLVVVFGSHEDTSYILWELLVMFMQTSVIIFLAVTTAIVVAMLVASYFAEKITQNKSHPRYEVARRFLPFAYPLTGGILGSITVMFAKASGELIKTSIFDGLNQFVYGWTYLVLGVTAITAVGQVFFLNRSLKKYDATYCIPVYYGAWVVFSITGGSLYFTEFEKFSALGYSMYFLGVAIMVVGVLVLSKRVAQGEESTAQAGKTLQTEVVLPLTSVDTDTQALLAKDVEMADVASYTSGGETTETDSDSAATSARSNRFEDDSTFQPSSVVITDVYADNKINVVKG